MVNLVFERMCGSWNAQLENPLCFSWVCILANHIAYTILTTFYLQAENSCQLFCRLSLYVWTDYFQSCWKLQVLETFCNKFWKISGSHLTVWIFHIQPQVSFHVVLILIGRKTQETLHLHYSTNHYACCYKAFHPCLHLDNSSPSFIR